MQIVIDTEDVANKLAEKGYDGTNFDGWTNELIEVLESLYSVESDVVDILQFKTKMNLDEGNYHGE